MISESFFSLLQQNDCCICDPVSPSTIPKIFFHVAWNLRFTVNSRIKYYLLWWHVSPLKIIGIDKELSNCQINAREATYIYIPKKIRDIPITLDEAFPMTFLATPLKLLIFQNYHSWSRSRSRLCCGWNFKKIGEFLFFFNATRPINQEYHVTSSCSPCR